MVQMRRLHADDSGPDGLPMKIVKRLTFHKSLFINFVTVKRAPIHEWTVIEICQILLIMVFYFR